MTKWTVRISSKLYLAVVLLPNTEWRKKFFFSFSNQTFGTLELPDLIVKLGRFSPSVRAWTKGSSCQKSLVDFLHKFTYFCWNVGYYNSLSQGRVTYIFLNTNKLLGICGLSQFWYPEAQEHNDLQCWMGTCLYWQGWISMTIKISIEQWSNKSIESKSELSWEWSHTNNTSNSP